MDGIVILFILSWKDRSKITREFLDLRGTVATGEMFKFSGVLCFICPHIVVFVKPSLTLLKVSFCKYSFASGD